VNPDEQIDHARYICWNLHPWSILAHWNDNAGDSRSLVSAPLLSSGHSILIALWTSQHLPIRQVSFRFYLLAAQRDLTIILTGILSMWEIE
jgi:hypothetical protein